MADDFDPFELVETSPGQFSLLFSKFEAAAEVFEEAGVEGGGYAWAAVARHVVDNDATELKERIDFDPEASLFCAFGEDRAALTTLGARLAQLLHDKRRLAQIVDAIGPRGFDD